MRTSNSGEQISLDFGEGVPRKPRGEAFEGDRLFFAIRPSQTAKEKVCAIAAHYRRDFALKGELRFELLHMTLAMVAEEAAGLPEHVIFAARQAAATINSAPISIRLDRIMSFRREGKSRPLVLHGEEGRPALTRLHLGLGIGMHNAGLRHNVSNAYTPHMTLLYDRKSVPPTELEEPVCWTADEFLLIRSELGKSTHHVVDRWPLLA
ncbi:2'-5' RNA ligase family protein [Rhizobium binxianense]